MTENAPERPGFFPNNQCRHYQLVDGWVKFYCIRTEEGHIEHETKAGAKWADNRSPWFTEEQVERVARAIWRGYVGSNESGFDKLTFAHDREKAMAVAREALSAVHPEVTQ